MGYVITRVSGNGRRRHTAVYEDLFGRRRSAGTFSTERLAAKAWQRAEADLAAGRTGNPQRGRQSLRRYVEDEWFPNHVIEASTREGYTYLLNRYLLPELGGMRMIEIQAADVRQWVTRLASIHGARPPTVRRCKQILDAILATALNDQVTYLHAGKGVKTPHVATKPRRIITAEQFERIHTALGDASTQLLIETAIESGLRWGELTELRVSDLDFESGVLTVSRAVVELRARSQEPGTRFLVKQYPKDREWRRLRLAPHMVAKISVHVAARGLGADCLLFEMQEPEGPSRRSRPEVLPDPETLGLTPPNSKGLRYRHGTTTAYSNGQCRCQHCRDVVAAYRATRRAGGRDQPRSPRRVNTDGHISNGWFRRNIWRAALEAANLGFYVTPHGLRHAHASWLLAGGADIQIVKERLGHGSIITTEKYLHALPDSQDTALAALAAVRGGTKRVGPASLSTGLSDVDVDDLIRVLTSLKAVPR